MSTSMELAARLSAVVATQQEVLAAVTDVEKVMALVVERTPEVTSGSGAIIEIVHGDETICQAASAGARAQLGMHLDLSSSLSGVAISTRELVRCDNAESDPRVDGAACRAYGIRSVIAAPLLEGEKPVGVLKSFSPHTVAFSELDAYVLQLLAGMASAALMQARAFRERESSEARYRMLFERNVAGVFRTTLDGRMLDCNEALAQVFGFASREELMSAPVWTLYENRKDREDFLRILKENKAVLNIRVPFKRKDGSPLLGLLSARLLPGSGADSELLGTVVEA